jgi:hypothetical protein
MRRTSLVSSRLSPVTPLALVAGLASLGLFGCSMLHHGATATDGGTTDGAPAASLVVDAAAPAPPPTPDNVNQVGRFPDETPVNDVEAKVADPSIVARNAAPGGAAVATLRFGTPVVEIAKHETFLLCSFADPKNPTHTLEGWIAEQAFVAGPTVPSKAGCSTGQTRLMFDEQDFCGRVCKNDSDCQAGQVCEGKANVLVGGKPGAEVTTCTVSPNGAPAAGPPAILPAGAGNACTAGYLYAANDKLCHKDCSKGACPAKSHCGKVGALSICEL